MMIIRNAILLLALLWLSFDTNAQQSSIDYSVVIDSTGEVHFTTRISTLENDTISQRSRTVKFKTSAELIPVVIELDGLIKENKRKLQETWNANVRSEKQLGEILQALQSVSGENDGVDTKKEVARLKAENEKLKAKIGEKE